MSDGTHRMHPKKRRPHSDRRGHEPKRLFHQRHRSAAVKEGARGISCNRNATKQICSTHNAHERHRQRRLCRSLLYPCVSATELSPARPSSREKGRRSPLNKTRPAQANGKPTPLRLAAVPNSNLIKKRHTPRLDPGWALPDDTPAGAPSQVAVAILCRVPVHARQRPSLRLRAARRAFGQVDDPPDRTSQSPRRASVCSQDHGILRCASASAPSQGR